MAVRHGGDTHTCDTRARDDDETRSSREEEKFKSSPRTEPSSPLTFSNLAGEEGISERDRKQVVDQ